MKEKSGEKRHRSPRVVSVQIRLDDSIAAQPDLFERLATGKLSALKASRLGLKAECRGDKLEEIRYAWALRNSVRKGRSVEIDPPTHLAKWLAALREDSRFPSSPMEDSTIRQRDDWSRRHIPLFVLHSLVARNLGDVKADIGIAGHGLGSLRTAAVCPFHSLWLQFAAEVAAFKPMRLCDVCGKAFEPTTARKVHCGNVCRKRLHESTRTPRKRT